MSDTVVLAASQALPANTAPSFGSVGTGIVTTDFFAGGDSGSGMVLQKDGKILVAGETQTLFGDKDFALARYNSDGSLDTSFGIGGLQATRFGTTDDAGQCVALQADGKILVAGYASSQGKDFFAIARYNANGTLDTTFDGDGKAVTAFGTGKDRIYSMAVQADGKILVAGESSGQIALARYNANGSLDTGFGSGGKLTTTIDHDSCAHGVIVLADGKILVAGNSSHWSYMSFDSEFVVARYTASGKLDTTFGGGKGYAATNIGEGDTAQGLVLQADGKIVVAGSSGSGNGDFALARYLANGALDLSFSGDGKVRTDITGVLDSGYAVALDASGKILVAGELSVNFKHWFGLVRYNSDGSEDTSFNGSVDTSLDDSGAVGAPAGTDSWSGARSVLVQPDGKILEAGFGTNNDQADFALMRWNANGTLDTGFSSSSSSLNGHPTFTEGGATVVLDSDVAILDAELAATNYAGATLTLTRHGGANAQDLFSAKSGGTLASLTAGAALMISGTAIGTVTTNADGTLLLSFNANATQARVNAAMQQIAYANSSDAPPKAVQIDWTFSDGNTGVQGTGGAASASGSTTVSIAGVNDASTGKVAISGTAAQGQTFTASNTLHDPDGDGAVTYQWQASSDGGQWTNLAKGATLALAPAQVGKQIRVLAQYTDGGGTAESVASAATNPVTLPPPTVTITDNIAGIANATSKLSYTLKFNQAVTGLTADDFTVSNGTLGAVSGSGTTWTVNVTPKANVAAAAIGLTLKAGAVTEAHGVANLGASNNSQTIDTQAPYAPVLRTEASFNNLTDPLVTLKTTFGDVVLDLSPAAAPATVSNMLRYVNDGFYDGTIFHRVIPGFIVQAGGLTSGLAEKTPTYAPIALESNNGLSNLRGTIAMARTNVPDSANSQFYINLVDNTGLNYSSASLPGYAVFGNVVSGMSVIDSIAKVPTATIGWYPNVPKTEVKIVSAQVWNSVGKEGLIQVGSLETGATWQYSTNGGNTWTKGNGDSFTLAAGFYGMGSVQVRQTDAAGNQSLAFKSTGTLVVDKTAPTVSAFSPADKGSGASVSDNITVTFSELIQRGSGSIVLKNAAGAIVETFNAATSDHITISGKTLSIDPTATLAYGSKYSVAFGTGAVKDLAGNAYTGSAKSDFTTQGAPLTGTDGDNVITGSSFDEALYGLGGDDILNGKAGNDRLTGGEGADRFVFDSALNASTNLDVITDFVSGTDKLLLSPGIFTKLNGDKDLSDNFRAGKGVVALDANDYLLFDTQTCTLYFDADASGKGAPVAVCQLVGVTSLQSTDLTLN